MLYIVICMKQQPAASGARDRTDRSPTGAAFLLSQIGAHAAQQFAERLAELELVPAQAGLLRIIARVPGQSQQVVASHLKTAPSRLVALVDGLEKRGLVERRRNADDRRNYALYLTDGGRKIMARLGTVGRRHEDAICAGLDVAEREQLLGLLNRIAETQQLTPMVHPGFRAPSQAPERAEEAGSRSP